MSDRGNENSRPKDTGKNRNPVTGIIDRLIDIGRSRGKVSVGEMTHALNYRSYGPFFLIPGLVGMSPLGAFPGMPTVLAIIVALFAGQIVLGRRHIWLPDILERQKVEGDRLERAMKKMDPVAHWLDRHFHERLQMLFTQRTVRIAAGICLLLVLPTPLLEVFPFAAALPMLVVTGFGLAMILRDGAVMIASGILVIVGLIASLFVVG
ncbi:exopolysaccharide biosynthesis protein [Thalassospira sp. TSL5-1]|uniref:exopolysaccharide biosynthesis protein n=1 Tax=Thalassospira sp. TSL5-1 TaxID=1544451 RepID=UPI001438F8E8|nr:exopolysaccharide biosynthesis protein [Thalassospira sp. TSL5-1]